MIQAPVLAYPDGSQQPQRSLDQQQRLALALALAHQQQQQQEQQNNALIAASLLASAAMVGAAHNQTKATALPVGYEPQPYDTAQAPGGTAAAPASRPTYPITGKPVQRYNLSSQIVPQEKHFADRGKKMPLALLQTTPRGSISTRPGYGSYSVQPEFADVEDAGLIENLADIVTAEQARAEAAHTSNPEAQSALLTAAQRLESTGQLRVHYKEGLIAPEALFNSEHVIGNKNTGLKPLPLGTVLSFFTPEKRLAVYQKINDSLNEAAWVNVDPRHLSNQIGEGSADPYLTTELPTSRKGQRATSSATRGYGDAGHGFYSDKVQARYNENHKLHNETGFLRVIDVDPSAKGNAKRPLNPANAYDRKLAREFFAKVHGRSVADSDILPLQDEYGNELGYEIEEKGGTSAYAGGMQENRELGTASRGPFSEETLNTDAFLAPRNSNDEANRSLEDFFYHELSSSRAQLGEKVANYIYNDPTLHHTDIRTVSRVVIEAEDKIRRGQAMQRAKNYIVSAIGRDDVTHGEAMKLTPGLYKNYLDAKKAYEREPSPYQQRLFHEEATDISNIAANILTQYKKRGQSPVRTNVIKGSQEKIPGGGSLRSLLKGLAMLPAPIGEDWAAVRSGETQPGIDPRMQSLQTGGVYDQGLGRLKKENGLARNNRNEVIGSREIISSNAFVNGLAANAMRPALQAALQSEDPAVRYAAQRYQAVGYETTFGPELLEQLTKRIRPLLQVLDGAHEGQSAPGIVRAQMSIDASERLALDVIKGRHKSVPAALVERLQPGGRTPGTMTEAVLNLFSDKVQAASKNIGMPHVQAGLIADNFFRNLVNHADTQVASALSGLESLSHTGDGELLSRRSTLPVVLTFGQRLVNAAAAAQQAADPEKTRHFFSAASGGMTGAFDDPEDIAKTRFDMDVAQAMSRAALPSGGNAAVNAVATLPNNRIIRQEYNDLYNSKNRMSLASRQKAEARMGELLQEQLDLHLRRTSVEHFLFNLNQLAARGTGGFALEKQDGPLVRYGRPLGNGGVFLTEIGQKMTGAHVGAASLDKALASIGKDGERVVDVGPDNSLAGGTNDPMAALERQELDDRLTYLQQLQKLDPEEAARQAAGTLKNVRGEANPEDVKRLKVYNYGNRVDGRASAQQALEAVEAFKRTLDTPAAVTPTIMEERNAAAYSAAQEQEALRQRAAATAAIMDERVASAARERPATWLGVVKNGAVVPGSGVQGPSEPYLQARMRAMFGPRGRR